MQSTTRHIAIVDDEAVTRARLALYFQAEGYRVSEADDGQAMWRLLEQETPDLILLDINLPGDDGLYLTRQIRAQRNVGIILVTGRSDEVDKIVGLELGADDYVTKPFNERELLARVKNLLRRTATAPPKDETLERFAGWLFDIKRRRLTAPDNRTVSLTRAEFELLAAFLREPGVVLSREHLFSHVTHRDWDPFDRTVDVLVRRLRRKIERDPKAPDLIITAHGEGYLFAADDA